MHKHEYKIRDDTENYNKINTKSKCIFSLNQLKHHSRCVFHKREKRKAARDKNEIENSRK